MISTQPCLGTQAQNTRFARQLFKSVAVLVLASSMLTSLSFAQTRSSSSKDTVSILFAGDVVLDGAAGDYIAQGNDPFAAFATLFKNTDIRVANLECVVATSGVKAEKNFTFRAHPSTISVVKRHFDAVSLANNHSGDFGPDAFSEMLGLLKQNQLAYFGGGATLAEAHTPLMIERSGLRIALLGFNEFMPRSFEASANVAGVAWSEDEQVVADIRRARSVYKADIVIPFMHWGWEDEPVGNSRQRQLARTMIDAGADAVIGGHPHVTQDVEHYKGKPIIYSIGNFVMHSLDHDGHTKGWIVRLEFNKNGVQSWRTHFAQLNPQGIPAPVPTEKTPCWDKEKGEIGLCSQP